jgi:aspartokinase/homoserine dehydrogenase 1
MLDLLPPLPASLTAAVPVGEPAARASLRIVKFGGSSLATPDRVRTVARLVDEAAAATPIVVVVSAFQGVTDALLDCARQTVDRDAAARAGYQAIRNRHLAAVNRLVARDDRATRASVAGTLRELHDLLQGIRLLGCCPPAALDSIASVGERLSAAIVAGHLSRLRPARFVDARDFVATDDEFTQAAVNLAVTSRAARECFAALWREDPSAVAVVTGFIGRSAAGRTTTIGRNGSDYTAAIVGAALGAAAIEIWTDVDGVLTADPRRAASPAAIPQISYADALEMASAGATVLHPASIGPAIARSIPIVIKNTLNPAAPGTRICASPAPACSAPAGSVTSIGGLTLLTLRSVGRPGGRSRAARLSHALASRGIELVFGSQACCELSIAVAVRDADAMAAIAAIQQEFCFELERGHVTLADAPGQALVTVIGAAGTDGVSMASGVFGALARRHVALSGFSQGASARSVSCLVDTADQPRAIRAVHRDLFADDRALTVALVGAGHVGGALLDQLHARQGAWRREGREVKVIGVANSRRSLFVADGVDLARWRDALQTTGGAPDVGGIAAAIGELAPAHAVLVDCTAGTDVVDAYESFVAAGCDIVTPNKRAGVLPWPRFSRLAGALAARGRRLLDSTTVGAGLPVLAAIREMAAGGDTVHRVEGILSGTLAYLFDAFDGTVPFSTLVAKAHAAGLTEPDPRQDLSGEDVRRKLLILARATGLPLELEEIDVAPVPADDDELSERLRRARGRGSLLRYIATLEDGHASAGLREIAREHPLAAGDGADNIVVLTSDRHPRPLVIRAPGAGVTVTARALVADLARLLPVPRFTTP